MIKMFKIINQIKIHNVMIKLTLNKNLAYSHYHYKPDKNLLQISINCSNLILEKSKSLKVCKTRQILN